MKNIFLLSIALIFSALGHSQDKNHDSRLLAKYSLEELSQLQGNDNEEYQFINHCLDNAWYITALPKQKMSAKNKQIRTIKIDDIKSINFYSLNISLVQDNYQFFAIEGTDKMLVIKSIDHIKQEIK